MHRARRSAGPTRWVPVTVDNFNRSETKKYFGDFVNGGALGKFWHLRDDPKQIEPSPRQQGRSASV